ncbi:MAG: hypothetical protein P8H97_03040 [Pseudomonadales bacterium]|nr:hypothetical protein [Pseudomonadales bacterium]
MTSTENKKILEKNFETQQLLLQHPPLITDENKHIVFELGLRNPTVASQSIGYSRWQQQDLPTFVRNNNIDCIAHDNFFSYPNSTKEYLEWHLNFAHEDLFAFYGGALFAQDEMQVAEHPILGCLREAILTDGIDRLTVENGRATPILLTNVERRVAVATDINVGQGRPYGLYGNEFSYAPQNAIKQATRLLSPPTLSNIIAVESPPPELGKYTREQVEFILATAITGFSAATMLTKRQNTNAKTSIHTGYWGCGAYGGNRELMPLLQIIAAHCANVDILHFHTGGDHAGYNAALARLEHLLPLQAKASMAGLIKQILAIGYEWGVSDGN